MVASVELVLERGERLELLVDKTDNLQQQVRFSFSACIYARQCIAHRTDEMMYYTCLGVDIPLT